MMKKTYHYYKKNGTYHTFKKLDTKYKFINSHKEIKKIHSPHSYKEWIDNLESFSPINELAYTPLISIIMPTYNSNVVYLKQAIESVINQHYRFWELCIADDASNNQETIDLLKYFDKNFSNIRVKYRTSNGHISEASNTALAMSQGDYIAFLDHDDLLSPYALYEVVKVLNSEKRLKLIYSDEDKIDENNQRFEPHFKSGWNPDLLLSQNYINHLLVLKNELIEQLQGFRRGYEGAQDYDLLLRALKFVKQDEIFHIEKILYHWRAIKGSTALSANDKSYTTRAGVLALQNYFQDINASVTISKGLLENTYKVTYPLPTIQPLVSILIPTRNGYEILKTCIDSIIKNTKYNNYEIIIIDNQTTESKTLNYFRKLQSKYTNIQIIAYDYPFNYSAINNFAVANARGELVTLLNNDIEIISDHWLTEMVQHALRPEIGAVGAKLYFDNDTIQHAGVILGIGGVAGHAHKYFHRDDNGYFSRLKIIQNYSAVTSACLVIRRDIYLEVNGMDEKHLTVAFNDIDFCLKVREKGYRNLWTPYAELYHHESVSRGKEDNKEKKERFRNEVLFMQDKWGSILKEDFYYNYNLTNKHENFTLKYED